MMERIASMIPEIPASSTAMPYTEYLKLKAEIYNNMVGDLEGYDCKICKNRGYISKIVDDAEVLNECKCLKIRETLQRIRKSGLETFLRQYTFKNYECREPWQSKLLEAAQGFAEQGNGFFFVGGQSGCGKTHLCTAIIGAMIRKGRSARYFVWCDDSPVLKAMINDMSYQSTIEGYKKSDVLYIDDLFKLHSTAADIRLALEIIDYRARNNMTTVISSEFTLDDMVKLDEAFGGRMVQYSKGNQFIIPKDPKKNYRLK